MDEQQRLIQDYVNGTLRGDALRQFEEALRTNADLRAEVEFSQQLRQTLQRKELLAVNELLSEVSARADLQPDYAALERMEKNVSSSSVLRNKIGWIIGAVAILLFLVLLFFLQNNRDADRVELWYKYLQPHENVVNVRGGNTQAVTTGMTAYTAGDYKDASVRLAQYLSKNTDNQLRLYLGISYLYENQSELAITTLNDYLQNQPTELTVGKWYLALAYLQSKQPEIAEQLLSEIRVDVQYGKNAERLLTDLQQEKPLL